MSENNIYPPRDGAEQRMWELHRNRPKKYAQVVNRYRLALAAAGMTNDPNAPTETTPVPTAAPDPKLSGDLLAALKADGVSLTRLLAFVSSNPGTLATTIAADKITAARRRARR